VSNLIKMVFRFLVTYRSLILLAPETYNPGSQLLISDIVMQKSSYTL